MSGRPKLNKNDVYSEGITIAVRKTMKKRIEKVVKITGVSINHFGREALEENLKKIEKELDI